MLKLFLFSYSDFTILTTSISGTLRKLYACTGLDIATCGVTNATGFGLLTTTFSRVVTSLATAISSYYLIFFFHFLRSMVKKMNVNCKPRASWPQGFFYKVVPWYTYIVKLYPVSSPFEPVTHCS